MNNTQIDNAKYINVVMPMYHLIEYRVINSKTSLRLWQYYRDDSNHNITEFESFKFMAKITEKVPDNDNKKS